MTINNFTELYNLLIKSGLQNTPPYANFINTVNAYKSACNCKGKNTKETLKNQAIAQYLSLINSIVPYVSQIKQHNGNESISFYNNGQIVQEYH